MFGTSRAGKKKRQKRRSFFKRPLPVSVTNRLVKEAIAQSGVSTKGEMEDMAVLSSTYVNAVFDRLMPALRDLLIASNKKTVKVMSVMTACDMVALPPDCAFDKAEFTAYSQQQQ
eukprot:TRINITY_DN17889_c0_g1_i1.p2 TRINITY_DN17889_c0_g1~~TRINITY_DN17889_c0_g1_i1.p2  ORF type:complete len:115 (+),score=21.97 TRINITY_DN17889_c0_g1_i1:54-398(+)